MCPGEAHIPQSLTWEHNPSAALAYVADSNAVLLRIVKDIVVREQPVHCIDKGADTHLKGSVKMPLFPMQSECVTKGILFDDVKATLPDFTFIHLCINKNVVCALHND